jgi:hypothetical protein
MSKTVRIEIDTGNAAFGETVQERDAEVARILKEAAKKLESSYAMDDFSLYDYNGNKVGSFTTD